MSLSRRPPGQFKKFEIAGERQRIGPPFSLAPAACRHPALERASSRPSPSPPKPPHGGGTASSRPTARLGGGSWRPKGPGQGGRFGAPPPATARSIIGRRRGGAIAGDVRFARREGILQREGVCSLAGRRTATTRRRCILPCVEGNSSEHEACFLLGRGFRAINQHPFPSVIPRERAETFPGRTKQRPCGQALEFRFRGEDDRGENSP